MARSRYCVFRIVNEARKEILLAATPRPIFDVMSGLRSRHPEALRGWDLGDITKFESLEFNLTKDAAREFVQARVRRGTRRGYRCTLEFEDA